MAMALYVRCCLMICGCAFVVFGAAGCKDHSQDVAGVWDWGAYAVHFDFDKSWGATDKLRPTFEKMGGNWEVSGNKLTMHYTGTAAPSADGSVFVISDDGITMDAETGATGTMNKRLAPASMDVK